MNHILSSSAERQLLHAWRSVRADERAFGTGAHAGEWARAEAILEALRVLHRETERGTYTSAEEESLGELLQAALDHVIRMSRRASDSPE
ncbi:MAG TPA: hypothetical protein VN241_05355 [Microbacterium sp.]|nr:hypothetical protein [Microbacterium sp.]